ncbi:MAG TPA: tape measure protein [Beutenbergiaceae bacterium]|nr:tape measure protein [Beutenbergiaceae bacterium]
MSNRSIAVRLRAEVSDFNREISSAASSLDQIVRKSGEGERAADTFAGRVAQSARLQRQEWTTVGTALTGVGLAVTGLSAVVLKTGIDYNNLRQTATQGLTAVTGSTEEAANQMRRLDEYGQNSWLMRDSLIRAQQQMTGFGIETNKVIPYMDALAEGVAATGGSNQTFEELAFTMSKVAGQGKITAQELNEFGQRGIDAATIIGEAMGKTGSQIRDEITAGALDAETALDALAAGLVDRYEGSSDLVRQTFRGAVDDVSAAFRDISAIIAAPLVDPEGGGLLVDFLNRLSDALFTLRDMPPALVQIPGWLTMLGGAATLGAGGLMLAVPRFVEFRTSIAALADTFPRFASAAGGFVGTVGRLSAIGATIAVTATAFGALSSAVHTPGVARSVDDIAASIEGLADAGQNLADLRMDQIFSEMATWGFDRVTIESENLGEALQRLADPTLAGQISSFFGELGMPSWMKDTEIAVAEADAALAHMVEAGHGELVQEMLSGLGYSAEELGEYLPQAVAALLDTGDAGEDAADGLSAAEIAAAEAEAELQALREAARGAAEGLVDLAGAFAEEDWDIESVGEYLEERLEILTGYTGNLDTLRERLTDLKVPFGDLADLLDDLDPQTAAALADELARAGDAELLGLLEDLGLVEEAIEENTDAAVRFREEAEKPVPIEVDDLPARTGFEELIDDFGGTTTDTGLGVDPREAIEESIALMGDWENTTTETTLSADSGPAMQIFNAETGAWEATTTDTLLSLDPDQAVRVFDRETGDWSRTTTDTLLNMDPAQAERRFGITTDHWAGVTTETNLDATDAPARRTMNAFGTWVSNYGPTATIYADVSRARAAVRSLNQERISVGAELLRAGGGPVFGPGSETSDSIAARLSHNEHVWSAAEVRGAGGHAVMEQMRAWARAGVRGFAEGGTPAYQYRPTFSAPAPVVNVQAPGQSGPLDLSDRSVNAIAAATVRMARDVSGQALAAVDRSVRGGAGRGL